MKSVKPRKKITPIPSETSTVNELAAPAASELESLRNPDGPTVLSADEQREIIAREAYLRAEHRGFEPGHELEDWLEAERETAAICSTSLERTQMASG